MFLARRFSMALTIAIFPEVAFLQIYSQMIWSSALILFYWKVWPLNEPILNILEIYNEATILICIYLVPDPNYRLQAGWVLIGIVGLNIVANWVSLILRTGFVLIKLLKTKILDRVSRKPQKVPEQGSKHKIHAITGTDIKKELAISQNISRAIDAQSRTTVHNTYDFDDDYQDISQTNIQDKAYEYAQQSFVNPEPSQIDSLWPYRPAQSSMTIAQILVQNKLVQFNDLKKLEDDLPISNDINNNNIPYFKSSQLQYSTRNSHQPLSQLPLTDLSLEQIVELKVSLANDEMTNRNITFRDAKNKPQQLILLPHQQEARVNLVNLLQQRQVREEESQKELQTTQKKKQKRKGKGKAK
ncbi:hypothetical protein FGO68_gene2050 [Halteria grandinella]|uniref:Uncharacterized protein n=1 Tax=Halteria grandinella TaxID=5974 RepID=A0A8J8P433_HALGN|nr:hypothetical protein FGO68_gene2050 [Halteria grandinella]